MINELYTVGTHLSVKFSTKVLDSGTSVNDYIRNTDIVRFVVCHNKSNTKGIVINNFERLKSAFKNKTVVRN